MHDGAIVKVLEGRHVLHPPDAAVVHGLHLLSGEVILLVGVHLRQKTQKYGDEKQDNSKTDQRRRWKDEAFLEEFVLLPAEITALQVKERKTSRVATT